jgi:hypothetical protein
LPPCVDEREEKLGLPTEEGEETPKPPPVHDLAQGRAIEHGVELPHGDDEILYHKLHGPHLALVETVAETQARDQPKHGGVDGVSDDEYPTVSIPNLR